MRISKKFIFLFLGFWVFSSTVSAEPPSAPPPPKLIVLIVIDGLSYQELMDRRELWPPGGFRLLLEKGAVFTGAHYRHANTSTGPGHATIATGTSPRSHGIIGNEWFDSASGGKIYCTQDDKHHLLDEPMGKRRGTSPKNLKRETVSDALVQSNPEARAFAVSIKDRAAILLAGKKGTAYFYSTETGRFITSTYYKKDFPMWLKEFHKRVPQFRWFGKSWDPLLGNDAYAGTAPQDRPEIQDFLHLGKKFPHQVSGGDLLPGPDYYTALSHSPFADEYLENFTEALMRSEAVGKNHLTDFLAVSFSAHDYINHLFGPESRESLDHLYRLDRVIARFLDYLKQELGEDGFVLALTSDHGFPKSPGSYKKKGLDSGRLDAKKMAADLNAALSHKFGPGNFISGWAPPYVYFNNKLIAEKKIKKSEVRNEAAAFLSRYPGIAQVFLPPDLSVRFKKPRSEVAALVFNSWYLPISGDLYLVQKKRWCFLSEEPGFAANHGSPYEYDTHVPLIFYGKGIGAATFNGPVSMTAVAPTLARLAGTSLKTATGKALAVRET